MATLLDQGIVALRVELAALDRADEAGDELALPETFTIEARYRQALLRAEIDFVGDLAVRVRNGTLGGIKLWRRLHELRAEGIGFGEIMPIRSPT